MEELGRCSIGSGPRLQLHTYRESTRRKESEAPRNGARGGRAVACVLICVLGPACVLAVAKSCVLVAKSCVLASKQQNGLHSYENGLH